MKLTFWLLDINYEVRSECSEIWLWGLTEKGTKILIIDRNFVPYFYGVLKNGADAEKAIEEIAVCQDLAAKPELVDRKLFGKPVKAVKIACKNAEALAKCAKRVRNVEDIENCFEDDIRAAMRYLIDNKVQPSAWHEIEADEQPNNFDVRTDKTYLAKSTPRTIEKIETPPLHVLGFSTIQYSREGTPKPDRNPIVLISAATNRGDKKQFRTDENKDDKPVLEAFMKYIEKTDPDIIVGYGLNGQDWQYLKMRCKKHGLEFHVGRTKTEPHTSVYGHVSLSGRVNLDIADYVDEFPEVKVKTLINLADYLGIMKIENRTIIEDIDFADYWDDVVKRAVLNQFSMDNTCCIMGISNAIMDFAIQLSGLVSLPLDHVGTAAAGFRVEWFIIKQTHELGEIVPRRIEQPYRPYAGGLVLQPKPGLHDNIAVLDFKSMYPNIMITYNLSPDTYVPPKEPEPPGGVYVAPEVKHRFRKEPPGFYKEILTYLIGVRDQIKPRMKQLLPRNTEYRILDARQKAVKVITNASYGYAGWTGARWYMKPVAEAAAAWGRQTIRVAIEMAAKTGLQVVYGDTDSIFIESNPKKTEELSAQINRKLGLEIKPSETYVRIFFSEAKKRYAGLLPDGQLDIVGMEVVRGDWAAIAKTVQEKVLEIILKERSPKKAVDFVRQFIFDFKRKNFPYRELIIWKTLTKPAEEYEVKASHVEAAKMLRAKGWQLAVGDKIGYVVVKGEGRLYERVKPYAFASYDDVDIEYYVRKQIVPAASRILESFGVTEEQLLQLETGEKEKKKLTDYFSS